MGQIGSEVKEERDTTNFLVHTDPHPGNGGRSARAALWRWRNRGSCSAWHRLGRSRRLRCSGYLFKMDAHRTIQVDCVYAGRTKVDPNRVYARYNGSTVSQDYIKTNMFQLNDLFGIPEVSAPGDPPTPELRGGMCTTAFEFSAGVGRCTTGLHATPSPPPLFSGLDLARVADEQ